MNNASIREELLTEVNHIATYENRTVDDVVNEAVQGEQRAAELAVQEQDVPGLVKQLRGTERRQ
jgi:hypothetical protein